MPYNKPEPNTVIESLVNEVCAYDLNKKKDPQPKPADKKK
jgi:hypothetical protein